MKASRLIFTLLLASSVAVVQLAAQQTKADQKPIEEVKAKAEAGDAESEVELGRRYDKGEGVVKDHAEAAKWFRKAAEQNYAMAQYNLGVCYERGVAKNQARSYSPLRGRTGRGGEVVSQSRRAELRPGSIQFGPLLRAWRTAWRRIGWRRRNGIAKPPNRMTPTLNTIWASATNGPTRGGGLGRGLQVAVAGSEARP